MIDAQAFLIAEFTALRSEIEIGVKHLAESFRNAIIFSGVIWAWLITQPKPVSRIVCMLPLVITAFFFFDVKLTQRKIRGIGGYLQRIEQAVPLPEKLGWETQLKVGGIPDERLWRLRDVAWATMLALNFLIALVYEVSPSSFPN